jgi:hypothetical protein
MILIYSPHDGEKREYAWNPGKLLSPEAEAIEDVGGRTWESFPEFGAKFMKNNAKALRAALWIMQKRENPRLKFSDVVVAIDELDFTFDETEMKRIREAIETEDIDEDQREELLSRMDQVSEAEVLKEPEPSPVSEESSGGESASA